MIEAALKLALIAHEGQRDWNGKAFILHPIRVMQAVSRFGEETMAAGVLHDSVEDSEGRVTLPIIAGTCGAEVARVVALLTHDPAVPYMDYVTRLCTDEPATRIKLADLADNIDPRRLLVRDEKERKSLVKHGLALQFLRERAERYGFNV